MSDSDSKPEPSAPQLAKVARPKRARKRAARSRRDAPSTPTPKPTPTAASGAGAPLPHELLLAVARGERVGEHEPTFAERVAAAKASARYFAPEEKAKRRGKAADDESGVTREIGRAKRTLASKLARLSAAKDGGKDK